MEHVVLLRGINVGGINIKMVDLRAALTSAGFADVRTVLATGNVRLHSELRGSEAKAEIERTLSTAFGYEAWVIVLDEPRLAAVVDAYPFDPEHEGWHPYVIFGNDEQHLAEIVEVADSLDPTVERIASGTGVVYWEVVKGSTTDSVVGKFTARAKFKATTTTRNLQTLVKLLA